MRRAFEVGVHGLVLTDHHYFWPSTEIAELKRRSQVPKYFLLVSGQEVATADFGDVLVYGADRTILRGTPLAEIRERFPAAALVWAHPYRNEQNPPPERLLDARLDAVEIFNSNHTHRENIRGLRDWHRYKFTALAGTDIHAASYTGTFPTLFDHPFDTIEELAEEVRLGRCRPFFQEIPREGSNIRITELTLGIGAPEPREKIIVKELESPKWDSAERAHRILDGLAAHGFATGRFRVPRPLSRDTDRHMLIEEGIEGRTLYDQLLAADAGSARSCLELAAGWLARLHTSRLCLTPPGEYLEREPERLQKYLSAFTGMHHKYTRRVLEIVETILEKERVLFRRYPQLLTQGHGDFNPKNILIGYDRPADQDSCFVAAIDFDSSYCMLPAFDVGTFLAQYRNQFFPHREVLRNLPEQVFLDAYLRAAAPLSADFLQQVELYRARANLSIAYYLIKVGLGKSENMWRVLVETDHALARLAVSESSG